MKKILAGVLAAASMLSVSATAFATTTDKTITKAGDVTYDVSVVAPKITLDLVLPAKIAAALNPYGAAIKFDPSDATKTAGTGIVGTAHKISNKSVDYGVYIDASAITTITTTDKTKWTVKSDAADTDGTKGAAMALVAAATAANVNPATFPAAEKGAAATVDSVMYLDSTVVADRTNGVAAGQVSKKKFAYLKAATSDGATPPTITSADAYIGLTGKLAASKADGSADVVWNEDDAINVNLVLKISAGPKTYT